MQPKNLGVTPSPCDYDPKYVNRGANPYCSSFVSKTKRDEYIKAGLTNAPSS